MFLPNLNDRKRLLLLVQAALSFCLLRGVTGDCGKCQGLYSVISSIEKENKCIRRCLKLVKKPKFSLDPVCDEDCCRNLCGGVECDTQGYCLVPPPSPVPPPTPVPPFLDLCLLCVESLELGCYRGVLGDSPPDCIPSLVAQCGYGEGEACDGFDATEDGQDKCVAMIKENCAKPPNFCGGFCELFVARGCYREPLGYNPSLCPFPFCGYNEGEACEGFDATVDGQGECLEKLKDDCA